jgi:hypothetical protein
MRALNKLLVYLFGLFSLVLFACGQDDQKKPVSLDSIRPHSNANKTQNDPKKAKDTLGRFLNYYANDSASMQIAQLSIDSLDELGFLNRFTANIQRYILQDSSKTSFQFCTWSFKDSSACLEAFYNWLDQAGKNNTSVPLLKGNVPSVHYNLMLIAEKQILFIGSKRTIDLKKWLRWYSGTTTGSDCKYILYSQPKKRTKWLKYQNAQIIAL